MRTVYGKLTTLTFVVIAALMLFLPMRSGLEDHLYAYPHSLRMNKGDSYDITYELDADHAQAVSYASLDESIATVTKAGRVTAMSPGATDIHLTATGGARTTVHIEVAGVPTTQLQLNTDYVAMEKGEVTGLSASFNEDAYDTRVEWRSMDPAIAEVNNVGRVTARRGGLTQVYALAPNGLSAAATVFVHVPGDVVRITPEELTVGTGATLKMGTYYLPDDTTDNANGWTSSDSHVLSVDEDGTIHANGVGQAILSVFTEEGLSSSSVVKVEQSAEYFDISPAAVTIQRGDSIVLEPRFLNADGTPNQESRGHYIDWISTNPEVASVENGRVIGHKSGTARITAAADGKIASCELRVQVLVREVTLDQEQVYLLREDTVKPIRLTATISPADPDDPTITFTTNNDMVANVSEDGLVTMTGGYGTAIITARAASGAVAHFELNVVTELPDPNATPTPLPLDRTYAGGTSIDGGSTSSGSSDSGSGGFSFDDIGNGVEAPKDIENIEGGSDIPASPASPAAQSGAASSGGFSFDDIGNGVEAPKDIADAGIAPANTPRTNVSQAAEASELFEY